MKNKFNYRFFKCFSLPLKDFLVNKGLICELDALDPCSLDKFWLFERDFKLDKALKEWNLTKPQNK